MKATVQFLGKPVRVKFELTRYQAGGLAVIARDVKDPDMEWTISVFIDAGNATRTLPEGAFYVKDWSENEEVVACLIRDGALVLAEDVAPVQTGFVTAKAWRIGSRMGVHREDSRHTAAAAMLEGTANNVHLYIEEMVKEVFDWLRPHHRDPYATNEKFAQELGARVVINWACESNHARGKFRVNYNRQANITALDNVFHALDGKGTIKSHHGPLTDAVYASENGTGETDYFRFRCFQNNNMHIEFKRRDLLAKLNAVAGGMTLKNGNGGAS